MARRSSCPNFWTRTAPFKFRTAHLIPCLAPWLPGLCGVTGAETGRGPAGRGGSGVTGTEQKSVREADKEHLVRSGGDGLGHVARILDPAQLHEPCTAPPQNKGRGGHGPVGIRSTRSPWQTPAGAPGLLATALAMSFADSASPCAPQAASHAGGTRPAPPPGGAGERDYAWAAMMMLFFSSRAFSTIHLDRSASCCATCSPAEHARGARFGRCALRAGQQRVGVTCLDSTAWVNCGLKAKCVCAATPQVTTSWPKRKDAHSQSKRHPERCRNLWLDLAACCGLQN